MRRIRLIRVRNDRDIRVGIGLFFEPSVTRVISAATSTLAPSWRRHRLLAFSAKEAVAKSGRERPTLECVLAIIGGIVEQHVTNSWGVINEQNMCKRQIADDDRLFEVILCPAFDRIARERCNETKGPKRLWLGHRRRRAI